MFGGDSCGAGLPGMLGGTMMANAGMFSGMQGCQGSPMMAGAMGGMGMGIGMGGMGGMGGNFGGFHTGPLGGGMAGAAGTNSSTNLATNTGPGSNTAMGTPMQSVNSGVPTIAGIPVSELDAEDLAELELMQQTGNTKGLGNMMMMSGMAMPGMAGQQQQMQGSGMAAAGLGKSQQDLAAERQAILEEKRTASREEVEQFCAENRLDPNAANIFRREPPDIQANVIDRGSMAECKNPSAALMGRLRDARQNRFKPVGGSRGTGSTPTLGLHGGGGIAKDVEDFIEQNKIDMGAARALRAEPPEVQQGVMDRGTLDGFQNPSALVMARIRDVKAVRAEAASRGVTPGESGSGGSSGQLTRELTREELRRAVEARKAGRGGSAAGLLGNTRREHPARGGGGGGGGGNQRGSSRSRSRGRGRGRSRSRSRQRGRSRSRSWGRRR